VKIYIKTDTGIGCIGFQCRDGDDEEIMSACQSLEQEVIFASFASVDEVKNGKDTTAQYRYPYMQ
jgi:alanine racemase